MATAREVIAVRLHDLSCPHRTCEPQTFGGFYHQADEVLAALKENGFGVWHRAEESELEGDGW